MLRKLEVAIGTITVALVCSTAAIGQGDAAEGTEGQPAGKGMAAMENAARANKYLFVFFYKGEDEPTLEMRKIFDTATRQIADRADAVAINTTDPAEKAIVDKFKAKWAPTPFVLAVAPNGAIIRSFRKNFNVVQLVNSFASPAMEQSLKALQDRKFVLLCVQNASTKLNDEAMRGVRDLMADDQYTQSTEVVMVDPSKAEDESFLRRLRVDPNTPEAVTVFLAPPGTPLGTFTGATDKDTLMAATTPKSGCGCSGGCGK